ncbi:hypothetical protein Gotur_018570, partial [Gossypium turneri]
VFTSVQDSGPLLEYIRTYVFASVHIRLLDRELIMKNGFLDKVEDNAALQTWSEATQREKGDSLAEGYVSKLWDFTRISVTQNSLQELKEIWDQWNDEVKGGDLVPAVEEYMALLHCSKIQADRVYSRAVNVLTFLKKLINITGMNEILYRCGNFDWVPLLGIWGAVGYAPLLVLRQYRSRQFLPATQGLAQCEFSYKGDGYEKKIREMSNAWNQTQ